MATLVGMAAIFGIIGGGLLVLAGLITALMEMRPLLRIAGIFRGKVTRTTEVEAETQVIVEGEIERAIGAPLPAFGGGEPLVYRHVLVQEVVGRRVQTPVDQVDGIRFLLRDGHGTLEIDAADARGLSMPEVGGGSATPAVLDWAGPVFAWPKTPKAYLERGLRVGDRVTVSGLAEKQRDRLVLVRGREALALVFGERNLWRTEEARSLGFYLALIPAGAALSALSYGALTLASGH